MMEQRYLNELVDFGREFFSDLLLESSNKMIPFQQIFNFFIKNKLDIFINV